MTRIIYSSMQSKEIDSEYLYVSHKAPKTTTEPTYT